MKYDPFTRQATVAIIRARLEYLPDIVEEHLRDGPFMWERWERALVAHDRNLDQAYTYVEDRLLGHVEGLCALGSAVLDLLTPLFTEKEERWAPAFAAHVLARMGTSEARDVLIAAVRVGPGEHAAMLRRGLWLARPASLLPALDIDLASAPPAVQIAALGLRHALRLPPRPVDLAILPAGDEHAQAAVVRLLRFADQSALDRTAAIETALRSPAVAVRNAAIETGLALGNASALVVARDAVKRADPGCGSLLPLLGALHTDGEALVIRALGEKKLQADALVALAYVGTESAAQACVEMLAQQIHTPLASEAFAAITSFEIPVAELPDDTPGAAFDAPGALLPVADVPAVIRWWNANRARFTPGKRYVSGKPRTLDVVRHELTAGPMRRRAPLAFEMLVRSSAKVDIDTSDFIGNQRRQMGALAELSIADLRYLPITRVLAPLEGV